MNLLPDTHTFVRRRDELHKLSPDAFAEISNPANDVFSSIIIVWELQIKIALNKFTIKGTLENVRQTRTAE